MTEGRCSRELREGVKRSLREWADNRPGMVVAIVGACMEIREVQLVMAPAPKCSG